uniref:Uncharacterized protein n=1 Tax=Oryza barthii TaxID=65489 RepID=A0A0D3FGC3_9ORYZ
MSKSAQAIVRFRDSDCDDASNRLVRCGVVRRLTAGAVRCGTARMPEPMLVPTTSAAAPTTLPRFAPPPEDGASATPLDAAAAMDSPFRQACRGRHWNAPVRGAVESSWAVLQAGARDGALHRGGFLGVCELELRTGGNPHGGIFIVRSDGVRCRVSTTRSCGILSSGGGRWKRNLLQLWSRSARGRTRLP